MTNLERWSSELRLTQERARVLDEAYAQARATYRREREHVAKREAELLDLITGRATAEQLPMDLPAPVFAPAPEAQADLAAATEEAPAPVPATVRLEWFYAGREVRGVAKPRVFHLGRWDGERWHPACGDRLGRHEVFAGAHPWVAPGDQERTCGECLGLPEAAEAEEHFLRQERGDWAHELGALGGDGQLVYHLTVYGGSTLCGDGHLVHPEWSEPSQERDRERTCMDCLTSDHPRAVELRAAWGITKEQAGEVPRDESESEPVQLGPAGAPTEATGAAAVEADPAQVVTEPVGSEPDPAGLGGPALLLAPQPEAEAKPKRPPNRRPCVVPGCAAMAGPRTQYVCGTHAQTIPLDERRRMLERAKAVRGSESAAEAVP